MTIVHHLTAMVALLALASPGLPALAEESVSPAPPSTAVPLEGTASALPAPTAPVEESTDESLPSEAATASAPPADTGAEGDLPESVAETAAAEVVRAEAPQARASATTLSVRSSVTGAYLQAGVGEYVFEGESLPGEVTIWWRNLANTDTSWKALLQVETDSAGAFSATDPIGPWVASVDWQATSSTDTSLPPSAVVTTVIHPATTLTVSSSSDGSLFRAGTGEYVFEGSAPPGAVQVQWANLARETLTWGNSVSTTADAEGAFIATAPIGPWEARFAWRVISPDLPGTFPSQTVYTTIEPGVTLSVWSTTTGSTFVTSSGNYVFAGRAPEGGITIWWRSPGSSSWRVSTTTQAWSTGSYRVEMPIGPWPGSIEWRATSSTDNRLAPSATRLTVVRPPSFSSSVRAATNADLGAAYRAGCPVGPSNLSVITMNYWGFDGAVHSGGELIVRRQDVSKVVSSFSAGFAAKFPIRKMVNPRHYKDAQDVLMMEDDNTSGFNCRQVVGNPYRTSPHSYGYAVDINPRENPYYAGGVWYPSSGSAYINRGTRRAGMHYADTVFPRQFTSRGGHWGGLYSDYHHFETVPR